MTKEDFRQICIQSLDALLDRFSEDEQGQIVTNASHVIDFTQTWDPKPIRNYLGEITDFYCVRESLSIQITVTDTHHHFEQNVTQSNHQAPSRI